MVRLTDGGTPTLVPMPGISSGPGAFFLFIEKSASSNSFIEKTGQSSAPSFKAYAVFKTMSLPLQSDPGIKVNLKRIRVFMLKTGPARASTLHRKSAAR